ncbi:metal-dependent hydrolase [Halovivax limisalsi]|uniref:metal-dependent hydrolase n=1 Tax=Halovivax limisalsi TaxID=1453760 RepID=UPI001FFD8C92|nr:metal-dependent hydrolase [Halovivax limisalsi]
MTTLVHTPRMIASAPDVWTFPTGKTFSTCASTASEDPQSTIRRDVDRSDAMVDIMGHVAFGLLFALPAWFVWDDRASVAFVGLAVVASLVPDIDLWLRRVFPGAIHHHGVTHTVLFVTVASLVVGAVLTGLLGEQVDDWIGGEQFDASSLFVFSTLGFLAGGLSHLVADILSAPDISTPIEPLWPVVSEPVGIDLIWYNAAWINVGFLSVMVGVHIVLASVTTPVDHRYRLRPGERR